MRRSKERAQFAVAVSEGEAWDWSQGMDAHSNGMSRASEHEEAEGAGWLWERDLPERKSSGRRSVTSGVVGLVRVEEEGETASQA